MNIEEYFISLAVTTQDSVMLMDLLPFLNSEGKSYAAINPSATLEILEILSKDEDYDVQCWVCENEKVSIEILKKLADSKHGGVRWLARQKLKIRHGLFIN